MTEWRCAGQLCGSQTRGLGDRIELHFAQHGLLTGWYEVAHTNPHHDGTIAVTLRDGSVLEFDEEREFWCRPGQDPAAFLRLLEGGSGD